MTRLFHLLLTFLLLSLLFQCSQSKQDDPVPDDNDPSANQNLVKTKYKIEGLDDDYLKEYELYTYYDIDTTSEGDTLAFFYAGEYNDKEFYYTLFFNAAFESRQYIYGEEQADHLDLGSINLYRKTHLIDSGALKISAIKDGIITASIDVTGTYGIRGKTEFKRYRLTADRIVATSKEYL